jgi:hypothetical protein
MSTIPVLVKKDHIEALVATKSPIVSVSELVWNGFDADADTVSVRFDHNGLGGLERIRVQDNGSGFSYDEAAELFGNLGGSWKSVKRRTAKGRSLHGKSGKGRFRAFALGSIVEWKTRSERNNKLVSFTVKGSSANLETFELGQPREIESGATGTEVVISNIHKDFTSLTDGGAAQKIAKYFAVYLAEYPDLRIDYDGVIVDPAVAQEHKAEYRLGGILISGGQRVPADLTIIEWNEPQGRSLHLCDARGISLHEMAPGIQAPGFTFSAYLKSDHLRELDKEGLLTLEDLHPDVIALLLVCRIQLWQLSVFPCLGAGLLLHEEIRYRPRDFLS